MGPSQTGFDALEKVQRGEEPILVDRVEKCAVGVVEVSSGGTWMAGAVARVNPGPDANCTCEK